MYLLARLMVEVTAQPLRSNLALCMAPAPDGDALFAKLKEEGRRWLLPAMLLSDHQWEFIWSRLRRSSVYLERRKITVACTCEPGFHGIDEFDLVMFAILAVRSPLPGGNCWTRCDIIKLREPRTRAAGRPMWQMVRRLIRSFHVTSCMSDHDISLLIDIVLRGTDFTPMAFQRAGVSSQVVGAVPLHDILSFYVTWAVARAGRILNS